MEKQLSNRATGIGTADSMIFANDRPSSGPTSDSSWKVLVVDDDLEVHRMTKYVLTEKVLVGKPLELLFAKSSLEAEKLLVDHEIACTLLDVVMEQEDSGLCLVKKIRNSMRNSKIRIILRTGQPGRAPEHSIMEQYEINDYREKTELTAQKLITAVTSAIRSYRDIDTIEKSRRGLRTIIDSSDKIFGFQSYKKFALEALRLLDSLLGAGSDAVFTVVSHTGSSRGEKEYTVLEATGEYVRFVGQDAKIVLEGKAVELIKAAAAGRKNVYGDIGFAMEIDGGKKHKSVVFMRYRSTGNPFERELLDVSRANIKSAFTNLNLYDEVQKLAHERGVLLKEVHHRVKNNLQVISSLIDFEISDRTADSEVRLTNIRNRIQSMATVHDCFYGSDNLDTVDFRDVAQSVFDSVSGSEPCSKMTILETEFESAKIAFDKAIPCSLIFGELVLNAFRHAANSTANKNVFIHTGTEKESLFIKIKAGSSDGAEANDLSRKESVSEIIVHALVAQLSGDYRFSDSDGMTAEFSLPL